jgi:hypothetical protein
VCAVPGFGQVQCDVPAAVPRRAGGDVDEVAADGGTAGLRGQAARLRTVPVQPADQTRLSARFYPVSAES